MVEKAQDKQLPVCYFGNKSFRPKTSSPLVVSPLVVSPQIWCLDVLPLHPSRFAPLYFFTLVVSPLYF